MQAHGFVHTPARLAGATTLFASLLLSACGGNTSLGIGAGSSSGGSISPVLAGTFTGKVAASQRTVDSSTIDTVFGAVDSAGNAFFADMSSGTNQAIFSFGSATDTSKGQISGFFTAYAANGSNLGNGATIVQNTGTNGVSGTVSSQSTGIQANLTFAAPTSSFSNAVKLVLDNPALAPVTVASAAGTYKATVGSSAISTSTNAADTYTVTLRADGTFTITDTSGCTFNQTSAVTADAVVDALELHASGSCPGNSGSITLSGLAVYLPNGANSPLGGKLTAPALLLELDDHNINSSGPKNAFALVASQQ
jgi:hypothetical protein